MYFPVDGTYALTLWLLVAAKEWAFYMQVATSYGMLSNIICSMVCLHIIGAT